MPRKKKAVAETARKTTAIALVLDESGSMGHLRAVTVKGVNDYVESLKKDTSTDATFTLMKFNTGQSVIQPRPIEQIVLPLLTDGVNYAPNGGTALLDAIGDTIQMLQNGAPADSYLVVVMTDGEENSSRNYTRDRIKGIVQTLEQGGKWTFVYLGAGIDAWGLAQALGSQDRANTMSYDSNVTEQGAAMFTIASSTGHYREAVSRGTARSANFISSNTTGAAPAPIPPVDLPKP